MSRSGTWRQLLEVELGRDSGFFTSRKLRYKATFHPAAAAAAARPARPLVREKPSRGSLEAWQVPDLPGHMKVEEIADEYFISVIIIERYRYSISEKSTIIRCL